MVQKHMIPNPIKFHSADVCRDGGTYVVSYLDAEKHFYSLELPVICEVNDQKLMRIGYKPPILKIFDPEIHGNIKETKQLTWDQGIQLREALIPLMKDLTDTYSHSHAMEMFEHLLLRGAVNNEP